MVKGKVFFFKTADPVAENAIVYVANRFGAQKTYMLESIAPRAASFTYTVLTSVLRYNVDTFILLAVSGASGAFAQQTIFNIGGGDWFQAEILDGGDYALLPVNFDSTGSFTVNISDGIHEDSFTITVTSFADAVGTYVRTGYHLNNLYAGVTRKLLIVGTGMSNVVTAYLNGAAVDFFLVKDTYLVLVLDDVISGANSITLYDISNTLLDTISISASYVCDADIPAFYYEENSLYCIWLDINPEEVEVVYPYVVSVLNTAGQTLDLLQNTQVSSASFEMIVRNKNGNIVPLASYTITGLNFVTNGMSDRDGKIVVALNNLPDYFEITFVSYELQYLNRNYSKATL